MDVLGSWVYPPTQFREALAVLSSGKLPFEELITHKFKVEEALKAIEASESGKCIKAMIKP
jgi:threonine dehydrogenase-like Zn-dependent dehydrogenase